MFSIFVSEAIERYSREVKTLQDKAKFYAGLSSIYLTLAEKKKTKPYQISFEQWNNATLLSHRNYYAKHDDLESLYEKCDQSLPRMVQWFVRASDQFHRDAEVRIKAMQSESCPNLLESG